MHAAFDAAHELPTTTPPDASHVPWSMATHCPVGWQQAFDGKGLHPLAAHAELAVSTWPEIVLQACAVVRLHFDPAQQMTGSAAAGPHAPSVHSVAAPLNVPAHPP